MVSVIVYPAERVSIAGGLPLTVELPGKDASNVTIGDVKANIAGRYPPVSPMIGPVLGNT